MHKKLFSTLLWAALVSTIVATTLENISFLDIGSFKVGGRIQKLTFFTEDPCEERKCILLLSPTIFFIAIYYLALVFMAFCVNYKAKTKTPAQIRLNIHCFFVKYMYIQTPATLNRFRGPWLHSKPLESRSFILLHFHRKKIT